MAKAKECALCHRWLCVTPLTTHHLIPRTRHGNKKNKKDFSRKEVRERTVELCQPCHDQVHTICFTKELERQYDTVEKLALHPEIIKFVAWIKEKPDGVRAAVRRKSNSG